MQSKAERRDVTVETEVGGRPFSKEAGATSQGMQVASKKPKKARKQMLPYTPQKEHSSATFLDFIP